MGAIAEMERAEIRERQKGCMAIAKANGANKGRKPKMTETKTEEIRVRIAAFRRSKSHINGLEAKDV